MASRSLGTLTLDLVAKTGMFEAGLDKAGRKMSALEKKAYNLGKNIGLAVSGAVVAGASASAVAVNAAINQMDELYNASQKIGIPTEVLAGFKYAAELSGVSIDQLQTGLGKLIKFQQDAAQGGKDSTRVFEAFGIAVKDAGGNLRSTQDLLRDFADVFKGLPDGPEKAALALQVFGKSGLELIPLLNAGSDGIKTMTDRARELGLVFDEKAGAQADEFNDKLDELKGAVAGLAIQTAIDLLPELIKLVDAFRENYTEGDKLSETAKTIGDTFRDVGSFLSGFVGVVQTIAAGFGAVATQIGYVNEATKAFLTADFERFAAAQANMIANSQNAADLFRGGLGPADSGTTGRRGSARGLGGARATNAPRDFSAAARSLQTPTPKEAKKGRSKKDNSEAERLREAEKAARDYEAALNSLNGVLDNQAELIGGDLTRAAMDYRNEMVRLQEAEDELKRLGKLDAETATAIAQARDQATAAYQKEVKAIQDRKTPAEELISDMQFELSLIGMTNAEKRAEIELRNLNIDAMSKEGAALRQTIIDTEQAIEAADRNQQAIEGFKSSFEDAFASILDGSKGIKEAFTDLANSILSQIARMIAQQWVQQLFGGMSGGGGMGGMFAGLFGSANGNVFSAGNAVAFANGGVVGGPTFFPMRDGRTGLMGEAGPEAIMPLKRGPDGKLGVQSSGGGGTTNNINVNVQPTTERRSAMQIAMRTQEKLRTAAARS